MKSISCKYGFIPLQTERINKVSLKFRCGSMRGFTLIEILVAVTIIATIVSMVYGSYFATAKSADVYKARMTMSKQTRRVLGQMARQIRCAYIGEVVEDKESAVKDSHSTNTISRNSVIYFSYKPDAPGCWILHLITTNRLFCNEGYENGLFDIAYKFDKEIGTLYISQRRFTDTSENDIEDRNWRPLLTSVKSIVLDFFDGRQWLRKWDYVQKRKLPIAVKIGITCEDENSRQCQYGTVAYVNCSGNRSPKTLSVISVNK